MIIKRPTQQTIFDRYVVAESDARQSNELGASEKIVLATDQTTNDPVLIRFVEAKQARVEEIFRFESQMSRLGKIVAPEFLRPIDWGQSDGQLFCTQRLNQTQSLAELMAQACDTDSRGAPSRPLALAETLTCLHTVLTILELIHQSGCVYRHVCPSQILVEGHESFLCCPGPVEFVEACDPDIGRALEFAEYASPELAGTLQHDVGPASDLYAVGILAYAMLCGYPPFRGASVGQIIFKHLTSKPDFTELGSDVPDVLIDIITRLLTKEPRDRYQSARAVLRDIRHLIDSRCKGELNPSFAVGRGDQRQTITDPAMVGRTEELALLAERFDHVVGGAFQTAMVVCPSGIGKTRLVVEAMRNATKKQLAIYRGNATAKASQKPTGPLMGIINQLMRQVKSEPHLRSRIARDLSVYQKEIVTSLPDLAAAIGWDPEEIVDTFDLSQTHINRAIGCVLASLGTVDSPAFIWVDDCQWIDAQSLRILEALQRERPANTFLIYTLRPSEDRSDEFLSRINADLRMRLGPLTETEIQALIESMAGVLPNSIIETVVQLAAGSPFMASAILRGMLESEALTSTENGWVVDVEKLAVTQAANDAAEALMNRLEHVSEATLKQLTAAAIIGNVFDVKTVLEILQMPILEGQANFDWARRQRFVWEMRDGRYAFVHDKIRESLFARMPALERQSLHYKYACYLKQHEPDRCFDIAYHYDAGDAPVDAFSDALKAADKARSQYSLDSAESLLQIALRGLDRSDRAMSYRVQSSLADVLMLDGKYELAETWFREARETASTPFERSKISAKRGELEFKRGNKERAVEFYESALQDLGGAIPVRRRSLWLQLVKEIGVQSIHTMFPKWFVARRVEQPDEKSRLAWRLLSCLANGYWFTRSKYYVLWAHLRGMNLAERHQPTAELAQSYSEHAPAMSLLPWFNRGIKYARWSLEIRKRLHDIWGQGQSRNYYSVLLLLSGRFRQAIEQSEQAEAILRRTGDHWEINIARYQHAASMYRLGDLRAAVKHAKRTYAMALSIGDFQSTGNIIDVWARAGLGEIPFEIIADEKARILQDSQGRCQMMLAEGVWLFGKNRFADASDCFQSAVNLAKKDGVVNGYTAPNFAWLATALRREFETNGPRTANRKQAAIKRISIVANEALRLARSFKCDLPHALRESGAVAAMKGANRRSRRLLMQSLHAAELQSAQYEIVLTQQMIGQIGLELGWPRTQEMNSLASLWMDHYKRSSDVTHANASISLIDRFDVLLDAGREIGASFTQSDIFASTHGAGQKLLRGKRTMIIQRSPSEESGAEVLGGELDGYDPDLVNEALAYERTVVRENERICHHGEIEDRAGTYLCSPIMVHGEPVACLYVANDLLRGLFGENEIRIAEYVASAAGAALERSDGFMRLEELNHSLENKVEERTAAVQARSRELEEAANALIQTQSCLELARDEAESANEAKSQFLARMSHEIRTPIAAILGFTELILQGVVSDPEDQKQKLKTIHASGEHLLRLVNDVLDLSKIEAGKIDAEIIDCHPVEIVQNVAESLQPTADQKSIGLDLYFPDPLPSVIQSDPTRLRQILTNLIGNAIKFTNSGTVAITTRTVGTDRIAFEIKDDGIGMDSDKQRKIFEPFSQADSSTTRKYGGTGLGLSISKRLAKVLGGTISVTSQLGVGSTFVVEISTGDVQGPGEIKPIDLDPLESTPDETHGMGAELSGCRILAVDDAITNRELLMLILEDAGAIVELAENGQQAVELLADSGDKFELVLMDMQMPILDGYTASQQLRESGFEQPIIALTANTMTGDEDRCLKAGCTDYLSKPIVIDALFSKIQKWIGTTHGAHPAKIS